MSALDDLEHRLKTLLEVNLGKLLPGYKTEYGLYRQLATALLDNLREENGTIFAPDRFVLLTHPSSVKTIPSDPEVLRELADALRLAGEANGSSFHSSISVVIVPDDDLEEGRICIQPAFSDRIIEQTQGVPGETRSATSSESIAPKAFLILSGKNIIPIQGSVINIGRRLENQIVLDDPRVSRLHAQLRVNHNQYLLFDLDSTGGTYVNGKRIVQALLAPGDLISLAGVTLVFNYEHSQQPDKDEETTEAHSSVSRNPKKLTLIDSAAGSFEEKGEMP